MYYSLLWPFFDQVDLEILYWLIPNQKKYFQLTKLRNQIEILQANINNQIETFPG